MNTFEHFLHVVTPSVNFYLVLLLQMEFKKSTKNDTNLAFPYLCAVLWRVENNREPDPAILTLMKHLRKLVLPACLSDQGFRKHIIFCFCGKLHGWSTEVSFERFWFMDTSYHFPLVVLTISSVSVFPCKNECKLVKIVKYSSLIISMSF